MIRAVKILVSVCLLGYLIHTIDWNAAIPELQNAEPLALLFAFFVLVVQLLISAWKWQISLSIHCLEWRIRILFRIIAIAVFFNNFLPTAVGGDIYRVYKTIPRGEKKSRAVSAVVLDRVVGLMSLLFVGAIGQVALFARDGDMKTGLLAIIFALPLIFACMLPSMLQSVYFRPLLRKLGKVSKFEVLRQNAKLILARKRKLVYLLGVSMLFQALAVLAIVLLFAAVKTTGVVAESAVVGAMYAIAALFPISINGLGVMEGSFALTSQQLGINLQSAIIVSLMLRLFTLIISSIGIIAYVIDRRIPIVAAPSAAEKLRD